MMDCDVVTASYSVMQWLIISIIRSSFSHLQTSRYQVDEVSWRISKSLHWRCQKCYRTRRSASFIL